MRLAIRRHLRLSNAAILIALTLTVGCTASSRTVTSAKEQVIVTDLRGSPIIDAELQPSLYSEGNRPVRTNELGKANVPPTLRQTSHMMVSKPGFHTAYVRLTTIWPVHVKLKPDDFNFVESADARLR